MVSENEVENESLGDAYKNTGQDLVGTMSSESKPGKGNKYRPEYGKNDANKVLPPLIVVCFVKRFAFTVKNV